MRELVGRGGLVMALLATTLCSSDAAAALRHVRTLSSPSATPGDDFGYRVLPIADGAQIVVSAPLDATGAFGSGAAYVFDTTSGALVSTFLNPSPNEIDAFGFSVAVVGPYLAVGAMLDDTDGENAGMVHIFRRDTGALER